MRIPFIHSRKSDIPDWCKPIDPDANPPEPDYDPDEIETPWGDLLAEAIREDVADLRRIADEVDDDHAEELRAIADNYELMADDYESG